MKMTNIKRQLFDTTAELNPNEDELILSHAEWYCNHCRKDFNEWNLAVVNNCIMTQHDCKIGKKTYKKMQRKLGFKYSRKKCKHFRLCEGYCVQSNSHSFYIAPKKDINNKYRAWFMERKQQRNTNKNKDIKMADDNGDSNNNKQNNNIGFGLPDLQDDNGNSNNNKQNNNIGFELPDLQDDNGNGVNDNNNNIGLILPNLQDEQNLNLLEYPLNLNQSNNLSLPLTIEMENNPILERLDQKMTMQRIYSDRKQTRKQNNNENDNGNNNSYNNLLNSMDLNDLLDMNNDNSNNKNENDNSNNTNKNDNSNMFDAIMTNYDNVSQKTLQFQRSNQPQESSKCENKDNVNNNHDNGMCFALFSFASSWDIIVAEKKRGSLASRFNNSEYWNILAIQIKWNIIGFCLHVTAAYSSWPEPDILKWNRKLLKAIHNCQFGIAYSFLHSKANFTTIINHAQVHDKYHFYVYQILKLIIKHYSKGPLCCKQDWLAFKSTLLGGCPWPVVVELLIILFDKIPNARQNSISNDNGNPE